MRRLEVKAFETVSGEPLFKIPFTGCSWTVGINEAGSLRVEVEWTRQAGALNLYERLAPWHTSLAFIRDGEPVQAGPVKRRAWDAEARKLTIEAGDGWDLMTKRLVLNPALKYSFGDGVVLIDEEHPPADWALTLKGTLPDIGRGLVRTALEWGPLPIVMRDDDGGTTNERTYLAPDYATVADRLNDLSQVQHGPEMMFVPHLTSNGYLFWVFLAEESLSENTVTIFEDRPGYKTRLEQVEDDGANLCSEVYGLGGRNNDEVLTCRVSTKSDLLLQDADKSHTTVSVLETLRAWCAQTAAYGKTPLETWTVSTRVRNGVRPGDVLDFRIVDEFLGTQSRRLKVMEISGDTTEWVKLATLAERVSA